MDQAARIRDAIRRILLRHARYPARELPEDQPLAPLLGFDSLALLLSVCDIEAELGVRVAVERIETLESLTFAQVVGLVGSGDHGPAPSRPAGASVPDR